MKMVFLFKEEVSRKFNRGRPLSEDILPDFEPYDFGPFSAQVYADLEFLMGLGFVEALRRGEIKEEDADEYLFWSSESSLDDAVLVPSNEEEFRLSKMGADFMQAGNLGQLTNEQQEVLERFKSRCTRVPLRTLLRYVYTRYPKMTKESRIRDQIMSRDEY